MVSIKKCGNKKILIKNYESEINTVYINKKIRL